jgi:hypothetical protein
MKGNSRIFGAVLVGVGTLLVTRHFRNAMHARRKLASKKLSKEANQSWEGEGGTIIDPVPRPVAS